MRTCQPFSVTTNLKEMSLYIDKRMPSPMLSC